MGRKLLIAAFAAVCIMSCSTDTNDTQTITINENIPEIVDLVGFLPATEFDETSQGKFIGVFGHHLEQELHGKIYINAGNDTRYTALIELVNGEQLKFTGVQQSRSNPDHIYFEGKSGSFDADFSDYTSPKVTNVLMNDADTEAYMVLVKSSAAGDAFVVIGNYEETDNEVAFYGNWDLIGNGTTVTAPFSTNITSAGFPFPVTLSGGILLQDIVTMCISHTDSTAPFVIDGTDDFDTNAAAGCGPAGSTIPSTEAVIFKVNITSPTSSTINGISAGGQTSMINGIEASWSFNYNSEITDPFGTNIPESYLANDCSSSLSGTWMWNGREGTTTIIN